MLHGGAWRWQEYLSLIPSLGRRWHTYALDLRGNGRSGWVPDMYRLRDFADDNAEFVNRLDAPAALLGHSIGGVIALMVAARCPEKLKALIIEDSPLTLDNYRRIIDSSRNTFGLWLGLKKTAQSEEELSLALADAYKDYPGVTSAWSLFFAGCLWQLDPTFFNALLHDFDGFTQGYDYKDILAKIDCPVLFLRGETKLGAVMTDDEVSWLQQNQQCAVRPDRWGWPPLASPGRRSDTGSDRDKNVSRVRLGRGRSFFIHARPRSREEPRSAAARARAAQTDRRVAQRPDLTATCI